MLKRTKFWTKPVAILSYLYENVEPDTGYIFVTYADIQKATSSSAPTVAKVMTQLQEDGLIKKVHRGVWQLCEEN